MQRFSNLFISVRRSERLTEINSSERWCILLDVSENIKAVSLKADSAPIHRWTISKRRHDPDKKKQTCGKFMGDPAYYKVHGSSWWDLRIKINLEPYGPEASLPVYTCSLDARYKNTHTNIFSKSLLETWICTSNMDLEEINGQHTTRTESLQDFFNSWNFVSRVLRVVRVHQALIESDITGCAGRREIISKLTSQ